MEDDKFYINGIEIPQPSSFEVSFQDVSKEAYRDSNGILHFTMIRKDVRKVYLKWKVLRDSEISQLLDAIDDQWLVLSYPKDPRTKGRHQITCYKGDRSVSLYSLYKGLDFWKDVSFNMIEQ